MLSLYCAMTERRVAETLNLIVDPDFDLFADSDRHALMDLLHDYFCGEATEESDSGKPNPLDSSLYSLIKSNLYHTDNEDDESSPSMEHSGNSSNVFTDFSSAGTDDEDDQPLVEDYSTTMLQRDSQLREEIEGPSTETTMPPAEPPADTEELDPFLAEGCGCNRAGQPCSSLFTKEHYEEIRLSCQDLSGNELDMVLLGQMMAGIGGTPQV